MAHLAHQAGRGRDVEDRLLLADGQIRRHAVREIGLVVVQRHHPGTPIQGHGRIRAVLEEVVLVGPIVDQPGQVVALVGLRRTAGRRGEQQARDEDGAPGVPRVSAAHPPDDSDQVIAVVAVPGAPRVSAAHLACSIDHRPHRHPASSPPGLVATRPRRHLLEALDVPSNNIPRRQPRFAAATRAVLYGADSRLTPPPPARRGTPAACGTPARGD